MVLKWYYVAFAAGLAGTVFNYQTHEFRKTKFNYYEVDCVVCSNEKLKEICPEYGWIVRNKYLTGVTISCKDAWGHVNKGKKDDR